MTTREQAVGIIEAVLTEWFGNAHGDARRLTFLIRDALSAAGLIAGGGEAVAYLYSKRWGSRTAVELWEQVKPNLIDMGYKATPLYTHPAAALGAGAEGFVIAGHSNEYGDVILWDYAGRTVEDVEQKVRAGMLRTVSGNASGTAERTEVENCACRKSNPPRTERAWGSNSRQLAAHSDY